MNHQESLDYVRETIFSSWPLELNTFRKKNPDIYLNIISPFVDFIIKSYSERKYHNIEHIASLLKRFEVNENKFKHHEANIIKSVIIFHDLIFIPYNTQGMNEKVSAEYSKHFYNYFLDDDYIEKIYKLIAYMNYNMFPIGQALRYPLANYIRDLELFNFGDLELDECVEMLTNMRKEYHLTLTKYWATNMHNFLEHMSKVTIYQTDFFSSLEENAKSNINGLIYRLKSTPEIFD